MRESAENLYSKRIVSFDFNGQEYIGINYNMFIRIIDILDDYGDVDERAYNILNEIKEGLNEHSV